MANANQVILLVIKIDMQLGLYYELYYYKYFIELCKLVVIFSTERIFH